MNIQGLQKLTLLDYPEKVACTVFTGGCNFRCPFCHNAELVINPEPTPAVGETDFFDYLQQRRGILDGVCVSGGEPLLQPDIVDFIAKIKQMGYAVKLDTNGSRPETLKQLVQDGLLDYVAMDIKNAPDQYGKTVGLDNFDCTPVIESAEFLMTNTVSYEFRTTVVKELHNADSFHEIALWLKGANAYYLQTFQDGDTVIAKGLQKAGVEEMQLYCRILQKTIPSVQIRGK